MLHAIIIDDEPNGLRSLELLIQKFTDDVRIVATTTDAVKGVQLINDFRPDVVFLDIYMPNLNGFELLEKLRFRNFHLIFTTAHEEFALRAIKQSATDYLLKPVDTEDLIKAIEKVKQKIKEKENTPDVFKLITEINELNEMQNVKISLPGKEGTQLVSTRDIIYIEASSNYSIVALADGSQVTISRGLKEYELQLCNKNLPFIRIHNSFIINLDHVTRYLKEEGGYAVIRDKKTVPISKHKKEEFLKWINLSI